jgi:prepilin-type processing-associated H-X9-DG protein
MASVGQNGQFYNNGVALANWGWSGTRWSDGMSSYTGIVTVIPPNGPSCEEWENTPGTVTPTSLHPGGVNVVLCDGAVRFISQTIDTGSGAGQGLGIVFASQQGQSPYGVWGALGSKDGNEPKTNF